MDSRLPGFNRKVETHAVARMIRSSRMRTSREATGAKRYSAFRPIIGGLVHGLPER